MTTGKTVALTVDLCWQTDISAFLIHWVCHDFPSKDQASLNFMAAVTARYRDFGVQKIESDTVSAFSPSLCHEVMEPDAMNLVF